MEVDRVVGIFERVPGEQQHDSLSAGNFALRPKLLETSQSHRRGGLASQTLSTQFSLGDGDFGLADIEAPSACVLDDSCGFAPRSRVANANRSCTRMSLNGLHSFA